MKKETFVIYFVNRNEEVLEYVYTCYDLGKAKNYIKENNRKNREMIIISTDISTPFYYTAEGEKKSLETIQFFHFSVLKTPNTKHVKFIVKRHDDANYVHIMWFVKDHKIRKVLREDNRFPSFSTKKKLEFIGDNLLMYFKHTMYLFNAINTAIVGARRMEHTVHNTIMDLERTQVQNQINERKRRTNNILNNLSTN